MIITVKEHYHYSYNQTTKAVTKDKGLYLLTPMQWQALELIDGKKNKTLFNNKNACFSIQQQQQNIIHCETNYYIGLDWVVENKLAIHVRSKLNNQNIDNPREVNYLHMLLEALEQPQNINHLDQLIKIDFNAPTIAIEQQQDMLTPFLIIQFLQTLKCIVKKGLKKAYYPITQNLNAKIKGKIIISQTVKTKKILQTTCQYSEFGINTDENKLLKKIYTLCCRLWPNYKKHFQRTHNLQAIDDIIHFITPAFENISDNINPQAIKTTKTNLLYKEYKQALHIGHLLLKKHAYNISQQTTNKVNTYPFWIDMSKLFELYVYSKLRKALPDAKIHYQQTIDHYTPDYLIDTLDQEGKPIKLVVDAKYTTKYKDEKTRQSDIRQVCAYARQAGVYKALNIKDTTKIIDCLIIYADQEAKEDFTFENILNAKEESAYINFRKLGIKLPEIAY